MAEEAKNQVNECEKEIAGIKARLKSLGPASESEELESKNSLSVTLLKVGTMELASTTTTATSCSSNLDSPPQTAGLPETADLRLKLQLTSPIEEALLTPTAAAATFSAVELGQAMLSMSATDADVPLGSAESVDLASLIQLDAMRETANYTVEQDVAFTADESGAEPVFHATLKLVFEPSPKDQREELYEMLNKASTRRSQAVEQLRQTALAAARQSRQTPPSSPAVKAGFLNKTKKEEVKTWWTTYFGPKSMMRAVLPLAKNYVIFGVVTALFHYKGDMLSLPPPV